jgi:ribonucleoside-diphosphate reductase alpha chain
VFRELAVSYLERFDLAHVDPSESGFDALGKGEAEGKPAASSQRFVSKGLTRSRTDRLQVVTGGSHAPAIDDNGHGVMPAAANVTAFSGAATALKTEPEAKLSPAQQLEVHAAVDARAHAKAAASEKRAEARAKGYEGEACGECGNFTLVRNGTCMKCDTCGSTTGCS